MKVEAMGNLRRTHRCDELRPEHEGKKTVLMGWVHRRRDLGGLIFIDLRDRFGITQVVINTDKQTAFAKAEKVRSEFVLAVLGTVRVRSAETRNDKVATGEIEVDAEEIRILNTSKVSPIQVSDVNQNVDETIRLQYRYIDLRRQAMAQNLVLRHRLAKAVRDYLDSQDFLEI